MSVTKEQIYEAIYYADNQLPTGDEYYHERGAWAVNALSEAYKEAIEALIQTKLTLEKHQRWTGQSWEQNHIADFEARKILDIIEPIIDKYPEEEEK